MTVVLMPVTVNAIQRATNLEDANEDEALCGSEERLYLDYLNPILLINAPLRSVFLSMNLVISHLCAWW